MTGPRLNPRLLEVPLYVAGKPIEAVQEELGLEDVVKLASNESCVGPSPLAVEAARRMLRQAHRYPGVSERELRRKLASCLGTDLTASNILVGNGGTDVLHMITQGFVFDGGNTVMSRTTFPMYRISTAVFGGTPRQVPATPDHHHDLAAMAARIDADTRIVYLCSPNNPTGFILTQAEVDAFLAAVPDHVVVVFDESYSHFVTASEYADSLAYVADDRNVLVVRSFSKSAGLANLRVGYVVGPERLTEYLRHAQLPFHTGAVALAAAAASLDDRHYLDSNRRAVIEGRAYLLESVRELGLDCLPSQANFLSILDPPLAASELTEALLQRGFIVRQMDAFGMPGAVRVTVGSRPENEAFVSALRRVLEEVASVPG